jgi:mannose-6-phosphate isomerase
MAIKDPTPIIGKIQHYAWGDTHFIPDLLGWPADGRPWAELWLGTHPSGPSKLADGSDLRDLTGELPYLLKVLAADQPLSLQVHPTREQAIDGYARGVYPDDRAKPELLCALTPFEAFCGIRPTDATLELLDEIGAVDLARSIRDLGVPAVITGLYRGSIDPRPAINACRSSSRPEATWVRTLDERYPGELSVAVALLLNYVKLAPGEALHLTAGNLHAYLHGAGIELMGASDNVVRGGLTVKHVDVDELLRIVDTTPLDEPIMTDAAIAGRYPLPEARCELVRLEVGATHTSTGQELAISLDGATTYLPLGSRYTPKATAFVVVNAPPAP